MGLQARKILISMLGRHRGEQLMAVSKSAGARGGTIALGRTVAGGRLLRALSLADVEQDIVFTIMGQETGAVLRAIQDAARAQPQKMGGVALLLEVSGVLAGRDGGDNTQAINCGSDNMNSGFQLITIIINHGYADDVMAAARKAGASGGTIISARGTGAEEDVKFLGITLVPEKEMLLIVCEASKAGAIIEAAAATPRLCEPGGGIVYTMNIEQFIVLGK
jgi:nitrogen regulatory protein PII